MLSKGGRKMNQEKIGRFISERRKEKGLTQMQLAEKLNITDRAVSKWETDVAVPELSKLVKMAEVFGISLDALVLGKEDEKKEAVEEPKVSEIKEDTAPRIEKVRESSRMKTGFGFFFLGTGTLLSFLLLILTVDILAALFVFIPFGLCAFFCLRQFRHAALWCADSWYICIMAYFCYATGTYWVPDIISLIHIDVLGLRMQTIMSFVFFFMLIFFICLTVFAYRKENFGFSEKKHKVLAVITVLAPILKIGVSLADSYLIWNMMSNRDDDYVLKIFTNYSFLINTLDFICSLAFVIFFTACLVPTVYWVRDAIRKRRHNPPKAD